MAKPRDAAPEYALVVWPDDVDQELPSCIFLCGLESALAYGAVLIAKEDAEWCYPRRRDPNMTLQSGRPRRLWPKRRRERE